MLPNSCKSAAKPLAKRFDLDVAHDVIELAGAFARVEQREMGVLEGGGEADLPMETIGRENGAELGAKHFERDETVVLEVAGK